MADEDDEEAVETALTEATPKTVAEKRAERDKAAVARIHGLVAKRRQRDADITAAEGIAALMDDGGNFIRPDDAARFTQKQINIARDARRPKRLVPVYVQHAHEREVQMLRADGEKGRGAGVTILINAPGGQVASSPYPIVELDKDGRRKDEE